MSRLPSQEGFGNALCDSNRCRLVAIGACDLCRVYVCAFCSHPTTPRVGNAVVCLPCLYG